MTSDSGGYVVRGRIVEWDATRVRQVEDVLKAWDAINADCTVVLGSGLLIDNGMSSFNVPGSDVTRLAEAVAQRLPKINAVAIVVSKDLHYGMARKFQVFAEKGAAAIQVFRDLATARQWLAERTASVPPDPAGTA
jgi:hypothetical protein